MKNLSDFFTQWNSFLFFQIEPSEEYVNAPQPSGNYSPICCSSLMNKMWVVIITKEVASHTGSSKHNCICTCTMQRCTRKSQSLCDWHLYTCLIINVMASMHVVHISACVFTCCMDFIPACGFLRWEDRGSWQLQELPLSWTRRPFLALLSDCSGLEQQPSLRTTHASLSLVVSAWSPAFLSCANSSLCSADTSVLASFLSSSRCFLSSSDCSCSGRQGTAVSGSEREMAVS